MSERPRYTSAPLPPYTYVPGKTPHPISDPLGHMHGREHHQVPHLDPTSWRDSEEYLYASDLFHHGYFWEAHEAWESLWISAGRTGRTADFLKGLIKLAAAGVKQLEGNAVGVERHRARALELLESTRSAEQNYCGINLSHLIEQIRSVEDITQLRWILE